jgi:hypothetical protein
MKFENIFRLKINEFELRLYNEEPMTNQEALQVLSLSLILIQDNGIAEGFNKVRELMKKEWKLEPL